MEHITRFPGLKTQCITLYDSISNEILLHFLQAADERNYHVFYEMLKGLDATTKSRFGLGNAERYFYLNQVGNTNIYIYILGESYMVFIYDVANRWVQCISIRPARRKMKVPRTQSQMLCLYELLVLSVDQ